MLTFFISNKAEAIVPSSLQLCYKLKISTPLGGSYFLHNIVGMVVKIKRRGLRKTRRRGQRGGGQQQNTFPRHEGNTYIFYHIYCNEHTFDVMRDQITKIIYSGLYHYVDAIYCCLAGNEVHMKAIKEFLQKNGKKFEIIREVPNDKSFERLTMNEMVSRVKPGDKFLYLHTKGVGRHGGMKAENIWWWRNWMEYNLMYRFRECITELNKPDVDLVGVAYREFQIGPHFSGNFWWMKGSYFATLPRKGETLDIGPGYNDPESFPFKGKDPKYVDMDPLGADMDLYSSEEKFHKKTNAAAAPRVSKKARGATR